MPPNSSSRAAVTNVATIVALLLAWSLLQSEIQSAREVLSQTSEQMWGPACVSAAPPLQPVTPNELSVSSWTLTALTVQTLRVLVQGYWTMARLRDCWSALARYLWTRRQQVHQESRMRAQLLDRFKRPGPTASLIFRCSSA